MADDLLYCLLAVAPIFLVILLGFAVRKLELVPATFFAGADKYVFMLALPFLLFDELVTERESFLMLIKGESASYIIYCAICVAASFILGMLIVPLIMKNKAKRGAFIQGMVRSNYAIIGLPMALNLFGQDGYFLATLFLPLVVPLYSIFAVLTLAVNSPEKSHSPLKVFKTIFLNIVFNPLIIALLLALAFIYFDISLPAFAQKGVSYISATATPVALLTLGANFRFSSLRGRLGAAVGASLIKTLLLPAIFVVISYLLGYRGTELGIIFLLFGGPTSVSSYVMAMNMKSDHDLAGQIILLTTMISAFTIFAGSFLMRYFGWI